MTSHIYMSMFLGIINERFNCIHPTSGIGRTQTGQSCFFFLYKLSCRQTFFTFEELKVVNVWHILCNMCVKQVSKPLSISWCSFPVHSPIYGHILYKDRAEYLEHLLLITRALFKLCGLCSSSGSGDQRGVLTYIYLPFLWFKLTLLPRRSAQRSQQTHCAIPKKATHRHLYSKTGDQQLNCVSELTWKADSLCCYAKDRKCLQRDRKCSPLQ